MCKPKKTTFFFYIYRISNQGAKHLATYLESGVKIRLEILLLGLNVIGDDGCLLLANVSIGMESDQNLFFI